MITKERAVEIAYGWGGTGIDEGPTALYQFASWGGRVVTEKARRLCREAIYDSLLWCVANRHILVSEEHPEHSLDCFAELCELDQFIAQAKVEPLTEGELPGLADQLVADVAVLTAAQVAAFTVGGRYEGVSELHMPLGGNTSAVYLMRQLRDYPGVSDEPVKIVDRTGIVMWNRPPTEFKAFIGKFYTDSEKLRDEVDHPEDYRHVNE